MSNQLAGREKCGRSGRYAVRRLIEQRGRDAKLIDWKDETASAREWPRPLSLDDH
jgi:hypothetical protein